MCVFFCQGTFGAASGLASAACSGRCFAGSYCPAGTASHPVPCPLGFYCPDGGRRWPCPAGTVGNATGLASAACSGRCPRGHFCPAGSAQPVPCPGGAYGDVSGLPSERCSGACPEGHYCPPGTARPRSSPCGSAAVYCPLGSARPRPVDAGAYSLGASDPAQQPRQQACEPGYFCAGGVRHACRNGTYGAAAGLAADPRALGLGLDGLDGFSGGSAGYAAGHGNGPAFWCDGFCARGHWCPPASTTSIQVRCARRKPEVRAKTCKKGDIL